MVNVALDHPVERYGIFIYFAAATADKAVTVSAQSNGAFGNEQSIIKKNSERLQTRSCRRL